jgi:tetraacyldisaccharide 4'-kinase
MSAWLEREWERLGGGALIFLPLTILYAVVTAIRRALYRLRVLPTWRAPVPVIVVGNINAGGTGKTPVVLEVLDILQRRGWTPGVVARGYGRVPSREQDPTGVVRVFPDVATPEHFGDEPVMIARRARVPVYISPDRPAAARALLQAHPDVNVLVSDDGLQHYALARDIELAVVDAERRFGNGLLLPSGPLREPRSRLERVDAVVVNGGAADDIPGRLRFTMRLGGERFVHLASRDELPPADFVLRARGQAVTAVAGIAHPGRFFAHLEALGLVARARAFPDHYAYQPQDLKLRDAELVLMTEKDAVKCAAFADARMWYLRVEAQLPPEFAEFLFTRLAATRRRSDGSEAG